MDKSKLRILSKVGLLLVIFGFFMPISCNMNGFQMARVLGIFGANLMSFFLYAIFIFSCLGILLPILYIKMNKPVDIKNDWGYVAAVSISFCLFAVFHSRDIRESMFGVAFRFQSGAYLIFFGLVFSIICLVIASKDKNNSKAINLKEVLLDPLANARDKFTEFYNKFTAEPNKLTQVFCTQCGNKLQEGNNFCTNCGAKILY